MSGMPPLRSLQRSARLRLLAIALLQFAPLAVALSSLLAVLTGWSGAAACAIVCAVLIAALCTRAWRCTDTAWTARQLDGNYPQLQDSSELLFAQTAQLSGLQSLQRARAQSIVQAIGNIDLRPAWPWRSLALSGALTLLVLLSALLLLRTPPLPVPSVVVAPVSPLLGEAIARLDRVAVQIDPPAYTGRASRSESALAFKAEEGSRLRWQLHFNPSPPSAALQFQDGTTLALDRQGDDWVAERSIAASSLYRVESSGVPPLPRQRLQRIEMIVDQAPEVRVIEPDKTLNLLEAGQRNWKLDFETSDDYGVVDAQLQITLAQGTGENISFTERTMRLAAEAGGDAQHKRYRKSLDLLALGIAAGDDLIVKLQVRDNRAPAPNVTRSASFILRWPAESSEETSGMDGMVQKVLPAYFRSQRQIIIDTEALIAEQPGLAAGVALDRSNAIGSDEKILRLRYGQFLGEEAETREHAAGPDADQDKASAAKDEHDDHAARQAPAAAGFGSADNIVAEFGHVHDQAEAATLLDPETKRILKAALAEMWQAELQLRLGTPRQALPFEYKALGFIKQVQQASRIYLERVGLELPAIDLSRRLSGELRGVADRSAMLNATAGEDAAVAALWKSLARNEAPDWTEFEKWTASHRARLPDALGLLSALDEFRRDPDCVACRLQLQRMLWPLLPTPAAQSLVRAAPDPAGRAYLEAIGAEQGP